MPLAFLYYRLRELIQEIVTRWEILDNIFSYLGPSDLLSLLYSKSTFQIAVRSIYRRISSSIGMRLSNQIRPFTVRLLAYQGAVQIIEDSKIGRANRRVDQLLSNVARDPQLFPKLRYITSNKVPGKKSQQIYEAVLQVGSGGIQVIELDGPGRTFEARLKQISRHIQSPRYGHPKTTLVGEIKQSHFGFLVWQPFECMLEIESPKNLSDYLHDENLKKHAETVQRLRLERYDVSMRNLGQVLGIYSKVTELGFSLPSDGSVDALVNWLRPFAPVLRVLWINSTLNTTLDGMLDTLKLPLLEFMHIRLSSEGFTSSTTHQAWAAPSLREILVQVDAGFHKVVKPFRMARWISQRIPPGCNLRILQDSRRKSDGPDREWDRGHELWACEVKAYRTERLEREWHRTPRGFTLVSALAG